MVLPIHHAPSLLKRLISWQSAAAKHIVTESVEIDSDTSQTQCEETTAGRCKRNQERYMKSREEKKGRMMKRPNFAKRMQGRKRSSSKRLHVPTQLKIILSKQMCTSQSIRMETDGLFFSVREDVQCLLHGFPKSLKDEFRSSFKEVRWPTSSAKESAFHSWLWSSAQFKVDLSTHGGTSSSVGCANHFRQARNSSHVLDTRIRYPLGDHGVENSRIRDLGCAEAICDIQSQNSPCNL